MKKVAIAIIASMLGDKTKMREVTSAKKNCPIVCAVVIPCMLGV